MIRIVCYLILASTVLTPVTPFAQTHTIRLNGGLEADVLALGRSVDHQYLSAVVRISNRGTQTAYLLLVGPVVAADNAGGAFTIMAALSGIAHCEAGVSLCTGIPTISTYYVPLEGYTEVDPGTDVTLNIRLQTHTPSTGPLVSLSASLACRFVPDREKDLLTPSADKQKQVRIMNLSIPPMPVTDGK